MPLMKWQYDAGFLWLKTAGDINKICKGPPYPKDALAWIGIDMEQWGRICSRYDEVYR